MRQRPTLEPLEPRILYSADTPSALAAALVGTPDAEHRLLDAEGEFAVQSASQEIVFIDARTPDSAQLVADITAQSRRDVEVIVLDAERNGLDQISKALAGRENVAALHVIGHGGEGVMQLGNTLVTADSLERNPGLVQAWGQPLTAGADILLYGCDIAATEQGRLLADTLARLTGADVSASDDVTGHARLGGDWNLEYTTGAIDVPVALSANTQDAWTHLLPSVVLTSYEPLFADMTDNAYGLGGGTTYAQTFSYDSPGATYTVNQIDLVLYSDGGAGGASVDIQLRSALGGGASNLLASGSVSRAGLTTSENWVSVNLNATATLTDSATYYIVVSAGGGGGIFVGIADTNGYPSGNVIIDGTPHTDKDMAFRVVSSDAPVVDLNGNPGGQDASVNFTEQTPVRIAQNGTITDPDLTNVASLTATLTARPDGDAVESLSLTAAATAAASGAGLTVSYTAGSGVLSITGSATLATYQTILRGVQYNNTSDAPTTTNRVVSVVVSDGTTPSVARTSVITVTAVNDAPLVDLNGAGAGQNVTVAFTEQTPVLIAPTGTIVDDSPNLSSLTLTLTARPNGNAVESLSLNAAAAAAASGAGLTVSYTAASGVLSITGSASVATYQTILQGVQYNNTSDTPNTSNRSVTVRANDGALLSVVRTSTVTVAAVNDAPLVDLNGAGAGQNVTVAFTEQTPVLIGPAGTLTDVDSANLSSLTLTLTARPDGDAVESLSLTAAATAAASGAGLTVSYTAGSGVLSITGSATLATYQTILRGVQYNNTSDAPTTSNRSVTVVANDGALASVAPTSTVTVAAQNDAPVLNAVQLTVNEGGTRVFAAADFTLSDPDSGAFTYTVSGVAGGSFEVFNGATWNAAASFTSAQVSAGAVRFVDDGDELAPAFSITANDGAANSATIAGTVSYTPQNDAPVLAGAGGTLAYTEGAAASLIDNALALTDVDDVNLESATVTISAGLVSAEDVLNFTSAFGISGAYNAATGVLTLSGSATLAQYEQVLESVTYQNTNTDNPNTGARTITWVVNDGTDSSAAVTSTVTVAAVNDAPVLNAVQLTVNEGGTRVFAAADFTLSDPDSGAFTYTVSGVAGGSFEVFNGATWNAAASFTSAQVSAGAVRFVDDGDELAPAFSITANDGAVNSATIAGTVSYTPQNDAPVNGVPGAQTGNEDSALVFSTSNGNAISIADVDAGASSVQVVLTGTNGAITLAGIAGLTFSVGDGVADSTMTFTGAAAAINAALNGLSFMPSAGFSGAADLSISVSDQGNTGAGGALSDSDAVAINVLPNVAPTVTASGGTAVFTEGSNVPSTPVVVDGAVTVSDPDSATLAAATISISAGWQAAEDMLGFTSNPATIGNIAGSYDAATGVLSLTSAGATATLAQWQEALRSVTYTNTSETPNTAARTVSFVVTGQGGTSAASTHQVAVTAMNDAPTVGASGGTTPFMGGGSPVVVDAAVSLNDVDNGTLAAARVWISGGFQAGQDVLGFSNNPTMGNITGSYDAASGQLTLSSAGATATLAQWQVALRSVTYGNTNAAPIVGIRSVSFDVSDGTAYAVAATTHAVDVSPNPVPPDPGPPPVVVPPPVIPPVVVGPPPVAPPPSTTLPPAQPAVPSQPAGGAAAAFEEAPIQPVTVDFAERPHNPLAVLTTSLTGADAAPTLRLAAFGSSVRGIELGGGDLLGEAGRPTDTRANGLSQSGEGGRSAGELTLSQEIKAQRDSVEEQEEFQSRGTVALAAGSLSMTLAYLLWLVRGGALVASALSALPAWRILDPLPVLSRLSDDEDEEEGSEDDDQAIASFASKPVGVRQ